MSNLLPEEKKEYKIYDSLVFAFGAPASERSSEIMHLAVEKVLELLLEAEQRGKEAGRKEERERCVESKEAIYAFAQAREIENEAKAEERGKREVLDFVEKLKENTDETSLSDEGFNGTNEMIVYKVRVVIKTTLDRILSKFPNHNK